jgi:excisionase family DNA binding protein
VSLRLDFDDETLDALAERIATRIPAAAPAGSPWMNFEALCEYTSIPEGTLRKMSAKGEIPSHGGRVRLYHRDEVDEALLGYSRRKSSPELRRIA